MDRPKEDPIQHKSSSTLLSYPAYSMEGGGPEFSTVVLKAGKAAAEVKGGEQKKKVWSDSFGTRPHLLTDRTRN